MTEETSDSTLLHSCGYPEDSFACKIRHLQMNAGDAKAALDFETP